MGPYHWYHSTDRLLNDTKEFNHFYYIQEGRIRLFLCSTVVVLFFYILKVGILYSVYSWFGKQRTHHTVLFNGEKLFETNEMLQ